MRPAVALMIDYASAEAKRRGHQEVTVQHLLYGATFALPGEVSERFGNEAANAIAALLPPPGAHFGDTTLAEDAAALIERLDTGDNSELFERLEQCLGSVTSVENSAAQQEGGTPEASEVVDQPSIDSALVELHSLVGLAEVKAQVAELAQMQRIANARRARGLTHPTLSKHLVFTGNPGTGKTTVARIVSRVYASLGLVSKGSFLEVTRADLVAGYVGQTAIKTTEICQKASGGVLFIDEAYALTRDGSGVDYGAEAIAEIVKRMEDERGDLAVIVAGYPREMTAFLDANPGLRSRFNRVVSFPDYDGSEMFAIFQRLCELHGYVIEEGALTSLHRVFTTLPASADHGNGRLVRNAFEHVLGRQALRLVDDDDLSDEDLSHLTLADCTLDVFVSADGFDDNPSTGQYL